MRILFKLNLGKWGTNHSFSALTHFRPHNLVTELLNELHAIARLAPSSPVRADLAFFNHRLARLPIQTRRRLLHAIATHAPTLDHLLPRLPNLGPAPRTRGAFTRVDLGTGPTNIRQGALGDCWFIATLAACEHTKPGFTQSLVTHVAAHLATVRLHWPTARQVLVTTTVPARNRAGDDRLDPNLASLVEKALATVTGSYRRIQFNFAGVALWLLTGTCCPARPVPRSVATLADWLATGRPVVASTLVNRKGGRRIPREDHPDRWVGVLAGHVYVVKAVGHFDEDGNPRPGQPLRVHLHNPLGGPEGEPRRTDLYLSARQFRRAFLSVNVGPVL